MPISDQTTNFTNVALTNIAVSTLSYGGQQMGANGAGASFSIASLVAPFVVQGSSSSFTIVVWSAIAPGDCIDVFPLICGTVSSLSSGLVPTSYLSLIHISEPTRQ